MALARLDLKTVSRGDGASALAKAAYISCSSLSAADGKVFDYTRKRGLMYSALIGEVHQSRGEFWRNQEAAETRCNSRLAREFTLTLPRELSRLGREQVAIRFATAVRDRYGLAAVDLAIHNPPLEKRHSRADKTAEQPHAHLLIPTRNSHGKKTRVLDDKKTGPAEVLALRALWQDIVNSALEGEGRSERVDLRAVEVRAEERRKRIEGWKKELAEIEQEIKQLQQEEEKKKKEEKAIMDAMEKAKYEVLQRKALPISRLYKAHEKDILNLLGFRSLDDLANDVERQKVMNYVAVHLRGTGHTEEDVRSIIEIHYCSEVMKKGIKLIEREHIKEIGLQAITYAFGQRGDEMLKKSGQNIAAWKKIEDDIRSNTNGENAYAHSTKVHQHTTGERYRNDRDATVHRMR